MSTTEQKFIRVRSGAVYRFCDRLAKRKDAVIVNGETAAEYFRSVGAVNDITKAYPEKKTEKPPARKKQPKRVLKKPPEGAASVIVSEEELDADAILEGLMGDGEDVQERN